MVLEESEILRERYSKKYCWKKQCEELVDRLWKIVCASKVSPLFSLKFLINIYQRIGFILVLIRQKGDNDSLLNS